MATRSSSFSARSEAEAGAGFQVPPVGSLLRQVLDLAPRMGLAYERSVGFEKAAHAHERLMIVCPRGACRMDIEVDGFKEPFSLDSTRVLVLPKGLRHRDSGKSAIYDTMALFPDDAYVEQLVAENGLGAAEYARIRKEPFRIRRTRWLDDILDRYFFERVLNIDSPVGCTFFLEKQILNELARILFADRFLAYGDALRETEGDVAERALQLIEAKLFEGMDLARIAEALRTSESTLLRSFKRTFGQTPYNYLKNRRLDEAAALLSRGGLQVGDVVAIVGYEDLSAFGRAFKLRFGHTPAEHQAAVLSSSAVSRFMK